MKIVQSKIISTADLIDGCVTNVKVNAAAAIDATKLALTWTDLVAAEAAATCNILTVTQQNALLMS